MLGRVTNVNIFIEHVVPAMLFYPQNAMRTIMLIKIETDLFCKPTDKHQYLLHSSSHPYHTKKSIPYSLALRLRRICSTDEFFKHRSAELQAYLTKRGYKRRFIQDQISRAKQIPRNEALKEQKQASKDTSDRVPFTITYNPALPNWTFKIYSAGNNLFYTPQKV